MAKRPAKQRSTQQQDVDITIDHVGRRGDGVGIWQDQPVFAPRTLPGEKVNVRLLERRDQGVAARLNTVLERSGDRAAPPCPYYDFCGGCALQHWRLEAYQNWKAERVSHILAQSGVRVEKLLPPIFIPDHTRRRATLSAFFSRGHLRLGYHRARSHDIVDIPDCLILSPRLQTLVNRLRPHLKNILSENKAADIFVQDTGMSLDVMITGPVGQNGIIDLPVQEAMAALVNECGVARLSWRARERDHPEVMLQQAPVLKVNGPLRVELPPGAFLQPSAEGEAALVAAALEPMTSASRIADLFCGSGTFSGPLLVKAPVHAVEGEEAVLAPLKKAAAKSGLTTARRNLFGDPLTTVELNSFDAVLFDPPRMGAKEQAAQLAKSAVPLVIGVSCNPATFGRDAALLQAGGYRLESVQVIDQFIWSSHLELVGVFRR